MTGLILYHSVCMGQSGSAGKLHRMKPDLHRCTWLTFLWKDSFFIYRISFREEVKLTFYKVIMDWMAHRRSSTRFQSYSQNKICRLLIVIGPLNCSCHDLFFAVCEHVSKKAEAQM